MSRGPGKLQRAILALIESSPEKHVPTYEVACAVFDVDVPTESQMVSIRRALRSLVAAGLVADVGRRRR